MQINGTSPLSAAQVDRTIQIVEILTGERLDIESGDEHIIDKYDSTPEIDC